MMDMIKGQMPTLPKHNCKSARSYSRATKMFMSNNHRNSGPDGQRNEIRRVAICRGTRVTATPLFRCLRYNSYLVQYHQRALEMSGELLIWLPLMSEAVSACRTGLCVRTVHLKGQGRSSQLPLPHQMGFGSPPLYSHNALFLSLPWH